MASGNFIIGKLLSMEAFDHYILPHLDKPKFKVQDRYGIRYGTMGAGDNNPAILVSITGTSDLEKELNKSLISIHKKLDKAEVYNTESVGKPVIFNSTIANNKKGFYKVLGVYKDDKAASKMFPAIAQSLILDHVEYQAEEVEKKIKELLSQKLGDI